MNIKYFNDASGLWENITGSVGDGLTIGTDGWVVGKAYDKIVGNLNQTTAGAAPNLYIFENTTGATITITFTSNGVYQLTSNLPIFIYEYLWIYIGNEQNSNGDWSYQMVRNDNYNLTIYSYSNFVITDMILKFTSFEIRIYPSAP